MESFFCLLKFLLHLLDRLVLPQKPSLKTLLFRMFTNRQRTLPSVLPSICLPRNTSPVLMFPDPSSKSPDSPTGRKDTLKGLNFLKRIVNINPQQRDVTHASTEIRNAIAVGSEERQVAAYCLSPSRKSPRLHRQTILLLV